MSKQKITGLLLLVCAYILLVPGLTKPMLTVSGTVEKQKLAELGREILQDNSSSPGVVGGLVDMVLSNLDVSGTVVAFNKTRSIIGTASELQSNGHLLVAVLIISFSVVIPAIKGLLVIGAELPLPDHGRRLMASTGNVMAKWSMADVFVIGIFIAYLAGNGIQEERGLVDFTASLEEGFWYFLGYCLLSIMGSQFLAASTVQQGAAHTGATQAGSDHSITAHQNNPGPHAGRASDVRRAGNNQTGNTDTPQDNSAD
ncbi:MAG: paraquat-inducible protein A [Granulosicoccus sp.]